jgi:hypothetical protein
MNKCSTVCYLSTFNSVIIDIHVLRPGEWEGTWSLPLEIMAIFFVMCVCVCVCVCACVCVCVWLYVCRCVCVCEYTYIYVYIYIYMYRYVCIYVCVCVCVCVCIHTNLLSPSSTICMHLRSRLTLHTILTVHGLVYNAPCLCILCSAVLCSG